MKTYPKADEKALSDGHEGSLSAGSLKNAIFLENTGEKCESTLQFQDAECILILECYTLLPIGGAVLKWR